MRLDMRPKSQEPGGARDSDSRPLAARGAVTHHWPHSAIQDSALQQRPGGLRAVRGQQREMLAQQHDHRQRVGDLVDRVDAGLTV
jgi:hypothetical protein